MAGYTVLPLDFANHAAYLLVAPEGGGGYRVTATVDGRELAQDYCRDWRRVERLRARLQHWLQLPGAETALEQRPAA